MELPELFNLQCLSRENNQDHKAILLLTRKTSLLMTMTSTKPWTGRIFMVILKLNLGLGQKIKCFDNYLSMVS
jgi:hypothetical protein